LPSPLFGDDGCSALDRPAATANAESLADLMLSDPITGIVVCSARAASGQAAAAPPSSDMNSRRFNGSKGIRTPPAAGL
jgi:hypothetical protein